MRLNILKNCRIFDNRQELFSVVYSDKIVFCGPHEYAESYLSKEDGFNETDACGMTVAPGFIDIHNHGGAGCDFAVCSEAEMEKAISVHLKAGTTTILPTAASADNETLFKMFRTYRNLKNSGSPASECMAGIHLEGPFLNPMKKGAMPPHLLRLPSPEEYFPILEKGGDILKRFTAAPELPGAFELGDRLASMGIAVSAGHTEADSDTVAESLKHGFSFGTHIFNGMSSMHKEGIFRKTGSAEAILANDKYSVEAISDCIHVPPEMLKLCWLIKGTRKMALISDAISAAGCNVKPGEKCSFVDGFVYIEDGIAKLPDKSAIAGSIACGASMLKCAVKSGIPFVDAVKMLTETPARLCGLSEVGMLHPGYNADMVVLDKENNPAYVIKHGAVVK